jgi:hypothetical protein
VQWPAAIPLTLRHPDAIEIFKELNGQISPNPAQAAEIGCGKCAVRMPGGKLFGDPLQLIERGWQEITIFCHPMHPTELLGAGEKRFEGREINPDTIDQLSHPRRTHAVGSEGGPYALPQGSFRGCRLYLVAGKMNDDAPAGNEASCAKLRDGTAQQRSRDRGSESRMNTGFIEPKPFRAVAVMGPKHVYDVIK